MRYPNRRRTIAALAGSAVAWRASAQASWPDRPIKLVVPYPPGAALDTVGRVVAKALEARLGQPVVVENRDGAGLQIGTAAVARARPDGNTWLINALDVFTLLPQVSRTQTYAVDKDLAYVARIASVPYAVHVNAGVPARTLPEFIALARQQPGQLRYGSLGAGSLPHVAMEWLADAAGIRLLHVPYRGMAAVTNDLLAGHIDTAIVSPSTMAPHVAAGRARTLALLSDRPSPSWPQIPTTADSGLRGVNAELGIGWVAPAGLPSAIIQRMADALAAVMQQDTVLRQLAERGLDPAYLPAAAFGALVKADTQRWKEVLGRVRITLD
ncbi:tripartite tricarboxylate transporter substrate binding protein [Pseudorhodoferax sp. LjRoot39]|uniref:Bug family tripartite tricarboxylate transporter substrate binding protein n=1 Tax=Pseudorhodoferax sp. LjRoot39 TaxID=3342328 RepID=UPI003ECE5C95